MLLGCAAVLGAKSAQSNSVQLELSKCALHGTRRDATRTDCPAFLHAAAMTPPIDLSHLFSPSSGAPPHPISCARMSVLGPLPPSTVFHLALNFIQKQKRSISSSPASKDSSVADADADADSLGSRPDVLLLCTSRSALFAGLLEENNGYLAEHGGDPALASLLQEHMEVRCLETTATWLFWCAAVQCGAPGAQHPPPPSPGERALDLKRTPDLVIVSGLSGLLGEDGNKGCVLRC